MLLLSFSCCCSYFVVVVVLFFVFVVLVVAAAAAVTVRVVVRFFCSVNTLVLERNMSVEKMGEYAISITQYSTHVDNSTADASNSPYT